MPSIPTREPLRVVLARLVTAGDQGFVDLVSPHAVYEEPRAFAFCLETQLLASQCIFCFLSPGNSFGPRFAMFAKPFPRFRSLCEDLEQHVQGLLASSDAARIEAALNAILAREPVWEERVRGSKILYYSEIAERLVRIHKAGCSEIAKCIRNEEMRAAAVPIDGGVEGPARDLPPSAITDEMFIGEDGCIHQSKNSARKWKILWIEEVAKGKPSKLKRPSDNACYKVLSKRRPGRPPEARDAAEARMKQDIKIGRFTREELSGMKLVALAEEYDVHRDTAYEALQNVLAENAGN